MSIRFDRLRAKGIGPFKEEIDVDFAAVGGPLVAVIGPNGSGKSTLLGLLAGGIYRDCPTRGSLVDLATARDAFLEIDFVNGAAHRAKHLVDAVSGKSEAIVMDAEGRPLTNDAKVRTFDGWVSQHVPPKDVLLASTFAAQASGGFLDMTAGERKRVLLRALQIEKLEALAERAREHVRKTKTAIDTLDARIGDARGRAGDPNEVSAALEELKWKRTAAEAALAKAREEHEEALAAEQVAKLARQEADAYVSRRAGIVAKIQRGQADRADIEKRIGNNRGVLERGDEIRKAVARSKELAAEREAQAAEVADLRAKAADAENGIATADQKLEALDQVKARSEARAARARAQLADQAKVEEAAALIERLRGEVDVLEGDISRLKVDVEETSELRVHGAENRIIGLRDALGEIAGGCGDAEARASGALSVDDEVAERLQSAPDTIRGLKATLAEKEAELATTRRALANAERLAARATEIANAAAELEAAQAEIAVAVESIKAAQAEHADATNRLRDIEPKRHEAELGARAIESELAKLEPLLKFAEPLAQAQARLDELSPQYERLGAELAALAKELEDLGDMPAVPPTPNVDGVRLALDAADRAFRSLDGAIAVKEAELTSARDAAARLTDLQAERAALDADLSDWTRLADELGPQGIQALELDAAGPEITEITNTLLHEAFGPRFTVRFDTVRRSSDGKKDIEAFDVSVLDTEKGREGPAETYSGGERVILGEAISLAISTIACRRAGSQEGCSLVRDESGAALDEDNARRYVGMVRKGAELIGASQVLLVSHSPAVWDLCDARIVIENGRVRSAA